MTAMNEAQLASRLADALDHLHDLESFRPANQVDVSVIWRDASVSNTASSLHAMQTAVNMIVCDNLQDLFATAVARQRLVVDDARKALLDLQFRNDKPSPYVAGEAATLRTTATTHDLTQEEIEEIGKDEKAAEAKIDAALEAGAEAAGFESF